MAHTDVPQRSGATAGSACAHSRAAVSRVSDAPSAPAWRSTSSAPPGRSGSGSDWPVGEYGAQWQIAGGQSFGQAHEIRHDIRLLTGEQSAGAAKTHGDFIGNQVHIVAITGFP